MREVSAAPPVETRRFRPAWRQCAVAALLLLLVLLQQWFAFAYTHEIGGDPDEPAHYVTGLLFHDYIAAGLPGRPMAYAENYYLHYPKIALGHWPPMFYVVQTVWTLPFGTWRVSVMLLMAGLATLLAMLVQRAVAEKYGLATSLIASCFVLALPVMEYAETRIMSESLEALFCFGALRAWGSYLQSPSWRASLGFFCLTACGILTKGTDLLLVAVPALSILLLRRFRLCLRPSLWGPVGAIVLTCLPAYTLLPNTGLQTLGKAEGVRLQWAAVPTFPLDVLSQVGPAAALLIATGFAVWLWQAIRGRNPDEHLTAAGCVILSFVAMRALVMAAGEVRHIAVVSGPLMLFLAEGASVVAAWSRRWIQTISVRSEWVMGAAAAIFLVTAFSVYPKPLWGLNSVLPELLADRNQYGRVFLVSSDSMGEGALIAETAMREARPGHFILRASQAFAEETWSGYKYRLRMKNGDEIGKYLDSVPVSAVILMAGAHGAPREHDLLLQQYLGAHPEIWIEHAYAADPRAVPPRFVRVFRRAVAVDTANPRIEVHLAGDKLGKTLHN